VGERCAGSRRRGKGVTLESLRQKDHDQTDLWRASHPGTPKGQGAGVVPISQVKGTEAKGIFAFVPFCLWGVAMRPSAAPTAHDKRSP
jgi:hypothetical protein